MINLLRCCQRRRHLPWNVVNICASVAITSPGFLPCPVLYVLVLLYYDHSVLFDFDTVLFVNWFSFTVHEHLHCNVMFDIALHFLYMLNLVMANSISISLPHYDVNWWAPHYNCHLLPFTARAEGEWVSERVAPLQGRCCVPHAESGAQALCFVLGIVLCTGPFEWETRR